MNGHLAEDRRGLEVKFDARQFIGGAIEVGADSAEIERADVRRSGRPSGWAVESWQERNGARVGGADATVLAECIRRCRGGVAQAMVRRNGQVTRSRIGRPAASGQDPGARFGNDAGY